MLFESYPKPDTFPAPADARFYSFLCPSAWLCALPDFCSAVKSERPFLLADDCSYRDLELYGGAAKTPHLNALAKKGMVFNRCYQSAPMCSPTRHSLYTGLHRKKRAYPNHARAYENVLSIPHYLQDKGYRVALAGKTTSPLNKYFHSNTLLNLQIPRTER